MGVTGLLPCLKSISHQVSLEKYRGLTVGVDAMCWLHKAVHASDPVALAKTQFHGALKGKESDDHVPRQLNFDEESFHEDIADVSKANRLCAEYVIRQVQVLTEQYQMNVILVLDGAPLPIKQNVNKKRTDNRCRMFHEAIKAERTGNKTAARKLFSQACSISYDIKLELIRLCGQLGIDFVVAPYEADAQIAKLAHASYIDLVLTEDSDLLLYGCPRVLFKTDLRAGTGVEIQILRDLGNNETPSFRNWTHDMFIYMCILSGCDYCDGISGLGLQTAHKLVRIHRTPQKLLSVLAREGRLSENFEQIFWMAFKTFRHQRVYCLEKNDLDFLFPLEPSDFDVDDWDFLGYWMDTVTSRAVASGILHPESKTAWTLSVNYNESLVGYKSTTEMGNGQPKCMRVDVDFSFFSKKRSQAATIEGIQQTEDIEKENVPPHGFHNFVASNQHSKVMRQTEEIFPRGMIRSRVPIHFEDYASALIGPSFETLSRSQRRNNPGKRYDILKALERLRYKNVSKFPDIPTYKPTYHPKKHFDGCRKPDALPAFELVACNSDNHKRDLNQVNVKVFDNKIDQTRLVNGWNKYDFHFSKQYVMDNFHDRKLLMELLQENQHNATEPISSESTFVVCHRNQSLPFKNQLLADDWTHCLHNVHEEKTTSDDEFTFASSYKDCASLNFKAQSFAERDIFDKSIISDINRLVDL